MTLAAEAPDADELGQLRELLGNEREQGELSAVNTIADAEVLLSRYLSGAYVQYSQLAWGRTEKTFLASVNDNWSEVASGLSGGVLALRHADDQPGGAPGA